MENKIRICAHRNCNNPISPGSNAKRVFCSEKCRQLENKTRRNQEDLLFNLQVDGLRKNYSLLKLYDIGSVLTVTELVNVGFNFDCLLSERTDEKGSFYPVGKFELRYVEPVNKYKLTIPKKNK